MRFAAIITASMLVPLLVGGASAAEEQRYQLEKSDSGYVRMDMATGDMSICEERSGRLVCRLAADERSAFRSDADRLQERIDALEERIARLEDSLSARPDDSLPTEEEFEKTMSYMERFFRGFIGIVKELEDESKEPPSPDARKT